MLQLIKFLMSLKIVHIAVEQWDGINMTSSENGFTGMENTSIGYVADEW